MALRDAFKGQIQARASPLLTVAIYLFMKATLFVFFFPTRRVVEVTDLRWVYWNGDRAKRAPTARSPSMDYKGTEGRPSTPRCPHYPLPPIPNLWILPPPHGWEYGLCGNRWPRSMHPHHRRGQSPLNNSSTPSKVIIDKGWHANVYIGNIIL